MSYNYCYKYDLGLEQFAAYKL